MKAKFATLVLAAALVSGPVMAQAPVAAPPKPSVAARMRAAVHPQASPAKPATRIAAPAPARAAANNSGQGQRTAKSLACSKQADAQNIHGPARKNFMSRCKKA